MKESILNPSRFVQIRGVRVEVTELKWKDYLRAIKELTSTVMTMVNKDGSIVLNADKIVAAIGSQEELVAWLLQKSLVVPGDTNIVEYVDGLSAREVMPLVSAIVELNLSEEVIAQGKTLAGQMAGVFSLKTASPKQSITSSVPATGSKTPTT